MFPLPLKTFEIAPFSLFFTSLHINDEFAWSSAIALHYENAEYKGLSTLVQMTDARCRGYACN